MVDIIIGSINPPGSPADRNPQPGGLVEAELLHVRPPRQRTVGPAGQERRKQARRDPPNGRVLTLMIADGKALPRDLDTKKYRVLVRFVKK